MEGTVGREEEISQDLGQIPTTSLKLTETSAQLCMVTSLVFEVGFKRDVQCPEGSSTVLYNLLLVTIPLLLRPRLLPHSGAASFPHL